MHKLLILSFWLLSANIFAQSQADLGKIQLSISFTEDQHNRFDQDLLQKTEGKLTQLLSNFGIASSDYNNGLFLQPNIIINSEDIVEGGMQNINIVNMTLQLLIKQDQTNLVFSSFSKTLKGTGRNTGLAINNAINSLSANDPSLADFMKRGSEKVLGYYDANCDQIISRSTNLDKSGRFEESLALLMSVPEAASCFKTAQNKSVETFRNFQKKNCSSEIKDAKMYIAQKEYSAAFDILGNIDSGSPCAAESNTLVKNIENKISAEEKKQWDLQMKLHQDQVTLQKQRINAIKDIAVSFYNSQKRPATTVIFR